MSGETSDISKFCELDWFEWVMLWDETSLLPDDVLKLGCYHVPSIYIGPAMMSTYCSLTPNELLDKDGSDAWEWFMVRVYERLGSHVLPRELEDLGLENTPQYDLYENETQNNQIFTQLAKEVQPIPEVGNHYKGAKKLLPWEEEIARGYIVEQSCDANGNLMNRADTSHSLNTRMYQAKITRGWVTE